MREDDHEQSLVYTTEELISLLSVTFPLILTDHAFRVEEDPDHISEVEPALGEAIVALGVIPLEFHAVK